MVISSFHLHCLATVVEFAVAWPSDYYLSWSLEIQIGFAVIIFARSDARVVMSRGTVKADYSHKGIALDKGSDFEHLRFD